MLLPGVRFSRFCSSFGSSLDGSSYGLKHDLMLLILAGSSAFGPLMCGELSFGVELLRDNLEGSLSFDLDPPIWGIGFVFGVSAPI